MTSRRIESSTNSFSEAAAIRKTNTEVTECAEDHGEKNRLDGKGKNKSKSKVLRI